MTTGSVSDTGTETGIETGAALAEFLARYSIETTPGGDAAMKARAAGIAPGTAVYVAQPPNSGLADVAQTAMTIQTAGFCAVPHLAARRVTDFAVFQDALMRMRDAGVTRALVIAGDKAAEGRIFDSTLDLFHTGALERFGFTDIAFAGHPEGSRDIGASVLKRALTDKLAYAAQSPSRFHIVTQFGFDPDAIIAYERVVRGIASDIARDIANSPGAGGGDIEIHAGMAGCATLRQLMAYAARCGVRSSIGFLAARSDLMKNMLAMSAPDHLVARLAEHRQAEPGSLIARPHFFAFGGLDNTAAWARAAIAGAPRPATPALKA